MRSATRRFGRSVRVGTMICRQTAVALGVGSEPCDAGCDQGRIDGRCSGVGEGCRRRSGLIVTITIAVVVALAAPALAQARVVRMQITGVQSPTFGGTSFGAVGQYEKVRGTMTGLVDPSDPKNALIADIANAPRNAQGLVEYTADFLILRPLDPSKGNHRVVYEPTNRGNLYRGGAAQQRRRGDRTIPRRRPTPATAS